jgi:N-acetylglucosamine malate deacetylase 2
LELNYVSAPASVADQLVSPFAGRAVLLIVAHPDDEVLFASSQLPICRKLWLVHASDGATRAVARQLGFRSAAEYGQARRREVEAALRTGRIKAEHIYLGFRDGHCCLSLVGMTWSIVKLINELSPDLILAHAYEGGHLDHDSVAFAVRAARELCSSAIPIWEVGSYNGQGQDYSTHRFATETGDQVTVSLQPEQLELKRRMIALFRSQQQSIAHFSLSVESFRRAPAYDFKRAPTDRLSGYEANALGAMNPLWCALARLAADELHGDGPRPSAILLKIACRVMLSTARVRRYYPRVTAPFERIVRALSYRTLSLKRPSRFRVFNSWIP